MNDIKFVTEYEYAAVALTAVITGLYGVRRTFHTRENSLFFIMLIFNFLSGATHIITTKTLGMAASYSAFFNYTVNILYLLSYNLTAIVYLMYVMAITQRERTSKLDRAFIAAVSFTNIFFLTTTPFTKLIFYFDEKMTYLHGPLFYLLPGLAVLILIYTIVLFIIHRSETKKSQNAAIIFFVSMTTIATIIQLAFPKQIISNLAIALSIVLLFNTIEDPADFIDPATGCLNSDAMRITLGSYLKNMKKFSVIAFYPEGISSIIDPIGIREKRRICELIYKPFEKHLNCGYIYYTSDSKFVVIADEKHCAEKDEIITRLRTFFIKPIEINGVDVAVTPHICTLDYPGFVSTTDDICDTINFALNHMIQNDLLTYEATEEAAKAKQRESHIISTIRNFISTDGFEMYYQPIYDTKNDCFESAEALIRMNDPELGFISPEEFIPLAEKNGYIIRTGEIAFRSVCRFLSESKARNLGIKYIEVNLSTIQCAQESLATKMVQIMDEFGIEAGEINFEITETAGLANYDTLLFNMNTMISHGVSFSMDDYGTGFSTANYLISLPTDIVKIDKSILWPAMKSKEALIILNHTIDMLRELGKKIVVEGVETKEMADILIEAGCDYLQGYYYSKPVPGDKLISFLEEHNKK